MNQDNVLFLIKYYFMARYFSPAGISLVVELMIKTKVVLAADVA